MEQVIKEGLRLYPSVPSYQRELTEDEQIGKKLVYLLLSLTNRSSLNWEHFCILTVKYIVLKMLCGVSHFLQAH